MKKLLIFYIFVSIFIPVAQGAIFYPNVNADKEAVFISTYPSTSMDSNTLDYFEQISKYFSVYIIQDTWVAEKKIDWTSALERSDLVFVIATSNSVMKDRLDLFCGNLSSVLSNRKGIVFAGNASLYNENASGCLYTPYFNLAEASNNTELKSKKVKIVTINRVSDGYELKDYNLSLVDRIYTIPYPKKGINISTSYGDPDGTGDMPTGNYPSIVTWEGLAYRAASWGINTSKITCDDCLGWRIFDQLLMWVSNSSDMGFRIYTDKEKYKQGERVYITISSPADISSISGKIIYPDRREYALSFTGSGKQWNSIYLIRHEDPDGKYTIDITADGIGERKEFFVKMFDLSLMIDNRTDKVNITVVSTKDTQLYENITLTINITGPGIRDTFRYYNQSYVYLTYNITKGGTYFVDVEAVDFLGNTNLKSGNFSFQMGPNVTIIPPNMTQVVQEPVNLTFLSFKINNAGEQNFTDGILSVSGEIKDWIKLKNYTVPIVQPNENFTVEFNISIPEKPQGTYTGYINLSSPYYDGKFEITIKIFYFGKLSITPPSWEDWLISGDEKTVEFQMKNSGRGNVTIKSIKINGEIKDYVQIAEEPDKLLPDETKNLKIKVATSDIQISDFTRSLSGNIEVETDQGIYYPTIFLKVSVIKNIISEADALSGQISTMEEQISEIKRSIDASDLEESLQNIKDKIEQAKTKFNQKEYEGSKILMEGVVDDINFLKSQIEEKQKQIAENRKKFIRNVVVFFGLSVILVLVAFIGIKFKKRGEYSWLYKKWKPNVISQTICQD